MKNTNNNTIALKKLVFVNYIKKISNFFRSINLWPILPFINRHPIISKAGEKEVKKSKAYRFSISKIEKS